jgi:cation transport ATPase
LRHHLASGPTAPDRDPIDQVRASEIVIVPSGELIPVSGTVLAGDD